MPGHSRTLLVAATGLLAAITVGKWISDARSPAHGEEAVARRARQERFKIWNTPLSEGRCAITTVTFGGTRARLVRVAHEGTIHFAVIEAPLKPTPLDVLRQGDWLRAQFGLAETATLGTFGTRAAALSTAGKLCPPRLRCLPGRPGCDTPNLPDPHKLYGPAVGLPGISTGP